MGLEKTLLDIDQIAKKAEMLPLVNAFRNREIEFGFSLQNIQTVFETFQIQPAYS